MRTTAFANPRGHVCLVPSLSLIGSEASLLRRVSLSIIGISVSVVMAACAATGPYNPAHINGDQVARIADICQFTIGLPPEEPPVLGVPLGTPHLDLEVSHYQACIASLSDSLRSEGEKRQARQADQECRAKSFAAGSSDMSECVLQRLNEPRVDPTAAFTLTSASSLTRTHSFFYASPHEARHREEMACAQIGLEPPYGAFAQCVKLLNDNFYAIDNPVF